MIFSLAQATVSKHLIEILRKICELLGCLSAAKGFPKLLFSPCVLNISVVSVLLTRTELIEYLNRWRKTRTSPGLNPCPIFVPVMNLYEMNPLEIKTSKNSEGHPWVKRWLPRLPHRLWSPLPWGTLEPWMWLFGAFKGAAQDTGRAMKTAQDAGENRRFDKKVWLLKGRNLRRTVKLHLD